MVARCKYLTSVVMFFLVPTDEWVEVNELELDKKDVYSIQDQLYASTHSYTR